MMRRAHTRSRAQEDGVRVERGHARRFNAFAACHILPPLLWQVALFLGPLLFLVVLTFWSVQSFRLQPDFTLGNWEKVYGQAYFWRAFGTTALFAAGGACLSGIVAFPVSYHIAFRLSLRAQRLAVMALIVPFFTSYLVRIYSWQIYLGDTGIINSLFALLGLPAAQMLNSVFGTFVGYLTLCLPLVILLQVFGFSQVPRELMHAAHNLGCGPLRVVFSVVIPGARAGLTLAALFPFILIFGDFASPIYLGGATSQTLSILITDLTKAGQQWPRAAVVAVTMIASLLSVALAAVLFAYRKPK